MFNCLEPSEQLNWQYIQHWNQLNINIHNHPSKKKEINTPVQNLQYKQDLQEIFQVLYAAYLSITPRHDNKINKFFNSPLITLAFYLT
jgi:hypothetical protein